jgi:hypothetical protein
VEEEEERVVEVVDGAHLVVVVVRLLINILHLYK